MKKYTYVSILSALFLILLVVVAYLIDNDIEITRLSLGTLADVTAVFTSIVTLSVVLLLYRRFNGSQALVDEQTKMIMSLLECIASIRFFTRRFEDGEEARSDWNILVFNYRHRDNEGQIFANKDDGKFKQYADHSLLGLTTGLAKFGFELYMPKKLADKIKHDFSYDIWSAPKQEDIPSVYITVSASGNFDRPEVAVIDDNEEKDDRYTGLFAEVNREAFDAEKLLQRLESIYEEAVRWLETNNSDVYKTLNLSKTRTTDFF